MLIAFLVIFLTLLPNTILAQVPTPDPLVEAHKTSYYQRQSIYQQAFNNYVEKYNINQKYGNITTQNEEFNALKNVFTQRNELLSAYLSALRVNLQTYRAVNFDTTNQLQNNLLDSENWLKNQNPIVSSISTQPELNDWIKSFKSRYNDIQKYTYTSLVVDEVNLDLNILNLIKKINSNLSNYSLNPELEKQINNQINHQSANVSTHMENAYNLFNKKSNRSINKYYENYNEAQKELNNAKQTLYNMYNNLKLLLIKS